MTLILQPSRRAFTAMLGTAGIAGVVGGMLSGASMAAEPAPIKALIHRDKGCGCCKGWMTTLENSGRFETEMLDEPDMAALKARLGVPDELRSCHTAEIVGYVIEGHVPVQDILRLLEQRPAGAVGLAVGGMPKGSPGMEVSDGSADAYDVVMFSHTGGRSVFSSYQAI